MEEIIKRKNESRKEYLLRVALAYFQKIENSNKFGDALSNTIRYDGANCDGSCLIEDIELEIEK